MLTKKKTALSFLMGGKKKEKQNHTTPKPSVNLKFRG